MSDLKLDASPLIAACLEVQRETGRELAVSLNKAAKSAIIGSSSGPGAMKLTHKASTASIAAVPDRKIAGAVAKRMRKSGKRLSREEFRKEMKRERARRKSAVGYAAFAGWNKAAQAMGARGVRGIKPGFEKSQAARGRGKKATPGHLEAVITNTAPAIEKIGGLAALQQGINNAALDQLAYIAIKKAAKKAGFK